MKVKFWNFINSDAGKKILRLEGPIAGAESWCANDAPVQLFKADLQKLNGSDITVEINSPGGDVFAAAEIYVALKNYRGKVNVEILLAASAASVVAMAGDVVSIAPTGMIMLHNPSVALTGNSAEMQAASRMLDEVKESIINAYETRTGLSRQKISELMDAETWMNAKKALELGFVDKILFTDEQAPSDSFLYSRQAVTNSFLQNVSRLKPVIPPIVEPFHYDGSKCFDENFGFSTGGDKVKKPGTKYETPNGYQKSFIGAVRKGFREVDSYLREGLDADGGFLVPQEMHDEIISELTQENVMRQIGRVITTQSAHKISIVANRPTASWINEGQTINFSSETFSQITLDAYKLAAGIQISNELLQDSFYDVEQHIITEFARALGNAEEDAFINGVDSGPTKQPEGFLTTLNNAGTDTAITTTTAQMDFDDVFNLVYALPRPYRQNACWLMNDATLQKIRKLKSDYSYYWSPSTVEGEPDKLLGYSVYTSSFFPMDDSSGSTVIAFGDFSRFIIGDRAVRTFKPLRELYATSDLTAFLMIERVDCKLVDTQSIKLLKIR